MQDKILYGQHLVCMMDLLGQKEMYKKLESFHLDEIESNKEFYNTLIKFVRKIDYFKQSVDSE